MQKLLLSIGTGSNQKPLIESAKALGFKIIGLDQKPDSKLVDVSVQCSTYDVDRAIQLLSDLDIRDEICGVLYRSSGPAVITAARLSEALGVPGVNTILAEISFSKFALAKNTTVLMPIPSQLFLNFPQAIQPSCVIKPDQPLYGKKNVYCCNTVHEAKDAFRRAKEESCNKNVVIQPYIEGRDLGVFSIFQEGRLVWYCAYLEANTFQGMELNARGVEGPVSIPSRLIKQIEAQAKAWGIDRAFVFFSFRETGNDQYLLYEVNPGLCGDDLADALFPKMFPGLNLFDIAVKHLIGEKFELPTWSGNPSTSFRTDSV